MTLGVFGGTFNPIHVAHLRVAEETREILGLSRILWVPAADPPHKHSGLAPADHRLEMVRRATATNPSFVVLDLELSRAGPSYTVDTIAEIGRRHPGDRLWFLIGSDALADVASWHRPATLLERTSLAVLPRPGTGDRPLEDLLGDLATPLRRGTNGLEHPSGTEVRLVPVTPLAISGSDLRRRIARGASVRYLVPDPVVDYVEKHRLYREEG